MSSLKDRLQADLTVAMKAREELRTSTLRMTLAAIHTEEVAGKAARELTDAEVLAVVTREAKKRREAFEAFTTGNRPELAAQERAEAEILDAYLPAQLSDADLADIVKQTLAAQGISGMQAMGQAMKAVNAVVAGRAEGGRVAAEVKRQLA